MLLIVTLAIEFRLKFVAGIGIPVDIEPESMLIGYVFKAQYFLPYNVTQLRPTRLVRDVAIEHMGIDGNGQKFETYDEEVQVKDAKSLNSQHNSDEDDDEVRWIIYRALEYILKQKRIDGKQCVLRAICEAVQLNFAHESGLLGEILHILLR